MTAAPRLPHCHRCGVPMELTDAGDLVCRPGGMDLAPTTRLALQAWLDGEETPTAPRSFRIGGRWHCPTDGTPLREQDGTLGCPTCDRSLPFRLVYGLVEFHVHARP